jgi:hypothetical protein
MDPTQPAPRQHRHQRHREWVQCDSAEVVTLRQRLDGARRATSRAIAAGQSKERARRQVA